jgi:biopolymer transport protein TolR
MPKVHAPIDEGTGRFARGRRVTSSLAEINVVPLVDVMLVLLIIFMVTAPMIQRGVDVNLPVVQRASAIEGERLFVTVPLEYRQSRIVYLNEERIRVDVLQERMRQAMETNRDKEVFLRGDGGIQLRELMEVFDRLQRAGVTKIGVVTREENR